MVSGSRPGNQSGGIVKLLNLTKRVKDLLQICQALHCFQVFDDDGRAVEASLIRDITKASHQG
jgi:hypothetical protein